MAATEQMAPRPGNSHHSGKGGNGTKATLASKTRTNWKKTAQDLSKKLEAMAQENRELKAEMEQVKADAPSLAEREATKLRRFGNVIARLWNAPMCDTCELWLGELLVQEITPMRETNGTAVRHTRPDQEGDQ